MNPQTLILSGSGAKYPAFLGAVRELMAGGVTFSRYVGTSGGSLIAALLASGLPLERVEKISDGINPAALLDGGLPRFASTLLLGFRGMPKGIYAGDKILAELRRHLPKRLGDCARPLHVVTYELESGKTIIWTNERGALTSRFAPDMDLPLLIMASMSLPIIFDSRRLRCKDSDGVERDQGFFCDGGVGNNFAIDLMSEGRDCIGIRFQPTSDRRIIRSFVDIAAASIDGMIESATRKHMSDAAYAATVIVRSDDAATDFELTPAKHAKLKELGRVAVRDYFARAPAAQPASRGAAAGVTRAP